MIRILIVDDSDVVAQALKAILNAEADIDVIGHAKNGRKAVSMTADLKPDLITMDIEMPELDGVEATRQIMVDTPTPIIIVSSHVNDKERNISFHGLEAGALTVLEKPVDMFSSEFEKQRKHLIRTVRAMAEVKLVRRYHQLPARGSTSPSQRSKATRTEAVSHEIVGIASSTGGPQALQKILADLPKTFPAPICIVQHISEGFVSGMVSWLTSISSLPLEIAKDGAIAEPGVVYFAPDRMHLLVDRQGGKIKLILDDGPPVNGFRPSGTPLLRSLAQNFGASAIGCILTGMGDDGADGLLELYNSNGHTFVQDEESSIIFGMPGAAFNKGATETCVALDDIACHLVNSVYGTTNK